jgi:two-component system, LytTR family, response regulator LytT
VVFLDVRMPGLDGFAVIRKLLSAERHTPLPQVVFATAFDQYAVKAFEVNAVDYLLKPFDSKRLTKTLDKLRARVHGPETASQPAAEIRPAVAARLDREQFDRESETVAVTAPNPATRLWEVAQAKLDTLLRMVEEQSFGGATAAPSPARTGRVVIRLGDRLLLVDQKDVCFASIDEGKISVVTKTLSGDSNVRTLEELSDQLDPEQFWRAHRSYLVNLQHIREVLPWFKSTYKLRMDDQKGTEIPVSRSQTKRLRELFNL